MRTSNEKNRRPSVVLSPFFEPFVIVSPMRRTPRLLPPRSLLLSRRFPARNFLSAKPFFLPKPTGPPSPVPKVRPVSARTPRFPSDDPPPRPSPSSVNRPGAPSPQTEPLLPNPRSSPAASSFCPCPLASSSEISPRTSPPLFRLRHNAPVSSPPPQKTSLLLSMSCEIHINFPPQMIKTTPISRTRPLLPTPGKRIACQTFPGIPLRSSASSPALIL